MNREHISDAAFIAKCLGLPADDLINHPGTRRLAADLHADGLPLTSIGPSGIGGEYQSETHPDRMVTEADLAADRAIVQSGRASPEQMGLLKHLAIKAVAGKLGGWERFEAEVNEVIRTCGKWGGR